MWRRGVSWSNVTHERATHGEQLEYIVFDFDLCKGGEQLFPITILYELHDEAVRARRGVMDNVQKTDNVWSACQVA